MLPVWHKPKDECGGGSAWAAGFIHAFNFSSTPLVGSNQLRRADLLAALCQESAGDFSRVTAAELAAAEASFAGKEARLPGAGADAALVAAAPEPAAARREIEATLAGMRSAGALAILRAKGPAAAAVARGVELASLGCAAMEVTLDSPEWEDILTGLRAALPPTVLLGVGTVMDDTVSLLPRLKALGATFALSPIDPVGFVGECQRLGLLAIPSAFTSNECWALHRRGVRLIKLFHAGLASPAILKSMLAVTPLGEHLNILPSGGVSPDNAAAWWAAGAAVIGMGSNLVGNLKDLPDGGKWAAGGRETAARVFEAAAARR